MEKKTVWLLWIMTELAIIGSDIQEVIGGAIALHVLLRVPLPAGTIIMACSTFALLWVQRFGIRKVEAIFAALIGVMIVAFWSAMVIADPDPVAVVEGVFVPRVSSYAVTQAVGILGAVIMPHNIYLHSALVTSRKLNRNNSPRVRESLKYNTIESSLALLVSFLINLAVVATFASSYFQKECASRCEGSFQGCVPVLGLDSTFINPGLCLPGGGFSNVTQTCVPAGFSGTQQPAGGFVCANIGLNNAGEALEHVFPHTNAAKYIWGIGLLAAGQASTITGTYAGQFVMAGFLNFQIKAWQRMLFTRMVALGPAVAVAWLTQGFPNTSDETNEWLNVLQSVQLPFALLPVLHLTSQRRVMGQFANGVGIKLLCWALTVVVLVTNIYLVYVSIDGVSMGVLVLVLVAAAAYFSFIVIIIIEDLRQFGRWVTCSSRDEGVTAYSEIAGLN